MPALIIALIILANLSIFLRGVRAYLTFTILAVGFSMGVAGLIGKAPVYIYVGLGMMAIALFIAFLSSLKAEPSQRPTYMFRFFLYGFFIFFMIIFFSMVITIPLAIFFKRISADYKEMLVVDEYGRAKGKVYVDKDLRGTDGKQYDYHDPY